MEKWDIYDKDRNKMNKTVNRGDYLSDEEHHLVVNVWIKNSKNELLIAQRSENKTFPLMWECVGGSAIEGETTLDAAIRETNEETKREVSIILNNPLFIDKYIDSNNNECECHYFLVRDNGKSDNKSLEVHDLLWIEYDKVYELLSYDSLKKHWLEVKDTVKNYIGE